MIKNKIVFLTSAILATTIMPAVADIALNDNTPTCDSSTIGATSGDTALDAVWNIVNQTCSAGQYFDMTTATCVTCTANSYCPGGTYNVESQTNGLNSCPNGYGLSAQGADAQTDCYRTCTTSDIAHSTGVSGEYYYGDNNQCEPTSCETGYTPRSAFDFRTIADSSKQGRNARYTYQNNGEWEVTYDYGIVHGQAGCSTSKTSLPPPEGSTGRYCYCKITGVKTDTTSETIALTSNWHYVDNLACEGCAKKCALMVEFYGLFLIASVQPIPASCEANTINITWKPGNGGENINNQCTYGNPITLPETPSRTGYNFDGWKVETGE